MRHTIAACLRRIANTIAPPPRLSIEIPVFINGHAVGGSVRKTDLPE